MTRPFAIKCKPRPTMANFVNPAGESRKGDWRRRLGLDSDGRRIAIARMQGILGKEMENVCQEKLLVLLFVVAAEFDKFGHVPRRLRRQQCIDCGVDVRAVCEDLIERRPRDHSPARAGLSGAKRLVVRVEQETKSVVKIAVVGQVWFEDHCLEEPGCVGEVPLGRASVRHRLHRGVGVGKGFREPFTGASDFPKEPMQIVRHER